MKNRGTPKRPRRAQHSARPTVAPQGRAATGRTRPAHPRSRPAARQQAVTTVALPSECSLALTDDLKRRLAELCKQSQPVTIEVSALRRIDTASMQLLVAFIRDRSAGDAPVRIAGRSPAFEEAVRLLGLAGALQPATQQPSA